MIRVLCILPLVVLLAACVAPPPAAPAKAIAKDARSVLVVMDEHSRVATGSSSDWLSVYQIGCMILGQKTQGLLKVVNEGDTMEMIRAAGLTPETGPRTGPAFIRIRRAHMSQLAALAASQGIDYLIVINDWTSRSSEYTHSKNDRKKILGSLGVSYSVETKGIQTERELDLTVWHCKSGRNLFTQRFKATDGGGAREKLDLDEWLGLAVVQRLMPESTQTERNPRNGDYQLSVHVSETLRMTRRNPPTSGTLGVAYDIPVTHVARKGDEVSITLNIENMSDDPLRIDFSGRANAFCLDKNGIRYDAVRVEGMPSGTLASRTDRKATWVFLIADRNVDFVNLHLQVSADLPPDFYARTDLVWKDILLYPLGPNSSSPPKPPSREIPIEDGSAWRMRDQEGQIYTGNKARGRPVVVFYCGHSVLEKTGMFSEGAYMGFAASRVGRLYAALGNRGFLFIWVNDSFKSDPNLQEQKKAAKKFGLNMPTVTVDEYYRWHIRSSGQPWLALLDANGQLVKMFNGATAITELDQTVFESLPTTPNPQGNISVSRPSAGDFGADALLGQVSGGSALESYQSVSEDFPRGFADVWSAVHSQARSTGIWRSDEQRGWIHTKGYIYSGAWNLLGPSRHCRQVITVRRRGDNACSVHVVTLLWKHHVNVSDDKSGRMSVAHTENADYDGPGSIRLSQKFLENVKKRLR